METMKRLFICLSPVFLASCRSHVYGMMGGPGYWFFIIFVLIPVGLILFKLYSDLGEIKESLLSIEGQVRRLIGKLESIEDTSSSKEGGSGDKPEQ